MRSDTIRDLENREILQKITDAGYGDLVDALIEHPELMMKRSGRLNVSALCRHFDVTAKVMQNMIDDIRELLAEDMG